jgi:FtsH-binding integral membrane protein
MDIFILLFMFAFAGAWLWFCFIWFTKDYTFDWKGMAFWTALALLIRAAILIWILGIRPEENGIMVHVVKLIGTLATAIFLYLVLTLRYSMDNVSQKLKLLLMWAIGYSAVGYAIHFFV